jgi:hypothetical protein
VTLWKVDNAGPDAAEVHSEPAKQRPNLLWRRADERRLLYLNIQLRPPQNWQKLPRWLIYGGGSGLSAMAN